LGVGAKVFTGGGTLTVGELWADGKQLPSGIYTSSVGWLHGGGYIVAGNVKRVRVAGVTEAPSKSVGNGNIALLKAASTFKLPEGDCSVHVATGGFPVALAAGGKVRYTGFITGGGAVRIEAAHPFEIAGTHANSYTGTTTLVRGVLRLNRSGT